VGDLPGPQFDLRAYADDPAAAETGESLTFPSPKPILSSARAHGGGQRPALAGSVESFVRQRPHLAALGRGRWPSWCAGLFRARRAGGRRSLGLASLTVQLLGGRRRMSSRPTPWAADSEKLAAEIGPGGRAISCNTTSPTGRPAAEHPPGGPTHLYYFATPWIARASPASMPPGRFAEFRTYISMPSTTLFIAVHEKASDGVTAFYPSSIFVEERPGWHDGICYGQARGIIFSAPIPGFRCRNRASSINRLPKLPTEPDAATLLPRKRPIPSQRILRASSGAGNRLRRGGIGFLKLRDRLDMPLQRRQHKARESPFVRTASYRCDRPPAAA